MKILILAGILMMVLIPQVVAVSWCDGDTLFNEVNITKNDSGDVSYIVFTEPIDCPHGCEDNLTKYGADCIEPDYIITLEVIIGIVLFFVVIFYIGSKGRGR